MARPRIDIGGDGEARLASLMRAGGTAESISAKLRAEGYEVSRATVQRRMQELRGKVRAGRPNAAHARPVADVSEDAGPALPAKPEDVPEGASLPELAALLARCKTALASAEEAGNLPLVGQMIRVAAAISETMRKATPPERPDPNESPDMVALAAEVRRRLTKMIDLVANEGA